MLLSYEASVYVNTVDKYNETSINKAIKLKKFENVKLLAHAGANLETFSSSGETTLSQALLSTGTEDIVDTIGNTIWYKITI